MLGRSRESTVQIEDQKVSRKHARVFEKPEGFYIRDLDSRHGTYVNGARVNGNTRLNDQDEITVGDAKLLFLLDPNDMASNIVHSYSRMTTFVIIAVSALAFITMAFFVRQLILSF